MRHVIDEFLKERLDEKLDPLHKKLAGDGLSEFEREKLRADANAMRERYSRDVWLGDAAKRASQIKLATHVLKMSNPEAKGSSIYFVPDVDGKPTWVCSATLALNRDVDVVGNAAALDVYKFLSQICDGETLLEKALRKDKAFARAISDDAAKACEWGEAFAALGQLDGEPASHPLAKQLYWYHEGNDYTLLAPLTSSSLSSAMMARINDERFSEAAKSARDAKNKNQRSDRPVRYFIDLVEQKIGGTKPQNVSYLNSLRGGANLLVASSPPVWRAAPVRLPRTRRSVFERELFYQQGIRPLLEALGSFLVSIEDRNNVRIRNKRQELTEALIDRTLEYGYLVQNQEAGWSVDCRLDIEECRWLDPGRVALDDEFAHEAATLDWRAEVCRRFGNWLNAQLNRAGLPIGSAEFRFWRDEFADELSLMKEALA